MFSMFQDHLPSDLWILGALVGSPLLVRLPWHRFWGPDGTSRQAEKRLEADESLRSRETELHRQRENLLEAQNLSHIGSWEIDHQTGHVTWSDEVSRIFEVEPGQIDASYEAFLNAIHPEDREAVNRAFAGSLASREPYRIIHRLAMPDGRIKHIQGSCRTYFDEAGTPTRSMGVFQDITELVESETERRSLANQLVLAQKMENLGVLAGGVAHDLNNVLAAILAIAQVQQQDSAGLGGMAMVIQACERGGKLVKGLLAFSRQDVPEVRSLSLNDIVRDQAALLERTTLQKVTLVLDLERDLRHIRGDAAALSHCLMNLCVNAVDAMPGGGTLNLRTRNDKKQVLLIVDDNGSGMSEEVLAKAYDPFFTTKPKGQGTGLGLSIVRQTVSAHGGTMKIETAIGQGTRVILGFPRACMESLAEPAVESAEDNSTGNLRVMVVDDDELILMTMPPLLRSLGHEPTAVSSGQEALALLESGYRPDILVLDMNLPGLGGKEILPLVRCITPDLPILLVTGGADESVQQLLAENRKVSLLSKPFKMAQLGTALKALAQN